jgi:hypothetical protein
MVEILKTEFPRDGNLWQNQKYYEYPRPDMILEDRLPPEPEEEGSKEEWEAAVAIIKQRNAGTKVVNDRKLQKWSDLQDNQPNIYVQMYNMIWHACSDGSQDRVRSKFPGFQKVADDE